MFLIKLLSRLLMVEKVLVEVVVVKSYVIIIRVVFSVIMLVICIMIEDMDVSWGL